MLKNTILNQYLSAILNTKNDKESEKVSQKVADDFEMELLNFTSFPSDFLEFILKLLSDKTLFTKAGIWNFLLVLSTESHILKKSDYEALLITITENFKDYENSDLCLACCDFIARNYPYDIAKNTFHFLKKVEDAKPEQLKGYVQEGIYIMNRELERGI